MECASDLKDKDVTLKIWSSYTSHCELICRKRFINPQRSTFKKALSSQNVLLLIACKITISLSCRPVNSNQSKLIAQPSVQTSWLFFTFFLLKHGVPHNKIQPTSRNNQDGSENYIIVQPKQWYIGGRWENRKRHLKHNKYPNYQKIGKGNKKRPTLTLERSKCPITMIVLSLSVAHNLDWPSRALDISTSSPFVLSSNTMKPVTTS